MSAVDLSISLLPNAADKLDRMKPDRLTALTSTGVRTGNATSVLRAGTETSAVTATPGHRPFGRRHSFGWLGALALCLWATAGWGQTLQSYLDSGHAALASQVYAGQLQQQPDDDTVRFEAGAAQVLAGTEGLAQAWYRHGLHSTFGEFVPFLRVPLPVNPAPEPLTYEDTRDILKQFQTNLDQAAATLSVIKDSSTLKVPVELQGIKLRIATTPGNPPEDFIRFWDVFQPGPRPGGFRPGPTAATNMLVKFDVGDARWLEGYCHALSAMIDVWLAYDSRDLFNHTAQLFFPRPVTPFYFLMSTNHTGTFPRNDFDYANIVDVITAVHLIHFRLEDPQRMSAARDQLLQVISLSRRSWQDIQAETGNDHEWIPNSHQDGALPGFQMTPEMIATWMRFLDESENLLNGKTLAPFWRNAPGNGINLEKVFTQPGDFDLILWAQGSAAAPYLEAGPVTDTQFWSTLNQVFHGQFLLYAVWIN